MKRLENVFLMITQFGSIRFRNRLMDCDRIGEDNTIYIMYGQKQVKQKNVQSETFSSVTAISYHLLPSQVVITNHHTYFYVPLYTNGAPPNLITPFRSRFSGHLICPVKCSLRQKDLRNSGELQPKFNFDGLIYY